MGLYGWHLEVLEAASRLGKSGALQGLAAGLVSFQMVRGEFGLGTDVLLVTGRPGHGARRSTLAALPACSQ